MGVVVLSVEGPLGTMLMQKPSLQTDMGHVVSSPLFIWEDQAFWKTVSHPGSHSSRGRVIIWPRVSPVGVGGPVLGALPNLRDPRPSLSSWFQASTYWSPFLGLGPLAAEIRLIPPLVEILVARTVSGTHNPTHSEWPQTGAWQGCPHRVLRHLPNCCPSLEHYLKSRRRAPPALPQLEGTLQTMVGWRCPACWPWPHPVTLTSFVILTFTSLPELTLTLTLSLSLTSLTLMLCPVLTSSSPLLWSLFPASPSMGVLTWVSAFLDSVGPAAEVKGGEARKRRVEGARVGQVRRFQDRRGALNMLPSRGWGRCSRTAALGTSPMEPGVGTAGLAAGSFRPCGDCPAAAPCPWAPATWGSLWAFGGAGVSCLCFTRSHQSLLTWKC